MGKGIFITGTNTGVGKTLVGGGLAALLREKGIDVGVMKPAESGCPRENGHLLPKDALFLKEMSGSRDELELINPYALEHPAAPSLAAELEGVEIRLEVIRDAYRTLASRHEIVLVEGAGGLLTPLTSNRLTSALVKELGLPVLLITRMLLGTINDTLLTLFYMDTEKMEVLGLVMNQNCPEYGLAESHNPALLQQWAKPPFLGSLPFLRSLDKESIRKIIETRLNLDPVTRWLRGE